MITFEQFVAGLGPQAKLYTPNELQQLHAEIEVLANVLLDLRKSRMYKANGTTRSPQRSLDDACSDLTITTGITEHVDGHMPSTANAP